jgi:aromatic ring-opening dioxygenase catalytic subunit (LigB family)
MQEIDTMSEKVEGGSIMINPIFVCHVGSTLAVDKNKYTDFLKDLGKRIKPKA